MYTPKYVQMCKYSAFAPWLTDFFTKALPRILQSEQVQVLLPQGDRTSGVWVRGLCTLKYLLLYICAHSIIVIGSCIVYLCISSNRVLRCTGPSHVLCLLTITASNFKAGLDNANSLYINYILPRKMSTHSRLCVCEHLFRTSYHDTRKTGSMMHEPAHFSFIIASCGPKHRVNNARATTLFLSSHHALVKAGLTMHKPAQFFHHRIMNLLKQG